jgi:hypothetical protein
MTGYRIDASGARSARCGTRVKSPVDLRPVGPCRAIMAIAEDFQDLVRAACPRCQGGDGGCLVERLRDLAGEPD